MKKFLDFIINFIMSFFLIIISISLIVFSNGMINYTYSYFKDLINASDSFFAGLGKVMDIKSLDELSFIIRSLILLAITLSGFYSIFIFINSEQPVRVEKGDETKR